MYTIWDCLNVLYVLKRSASLDMFPHLVHSTAYQCIRYKNSNNGQHILIVIICVYTLLFLTFICVLWCFSFIFVYCYLSIASANEYLLQSWTLKPHNIMPFIMSLLKYNINTLSSVSASSPIAVLMGLLPR